MAIFPSLHLERVLQVDDKIRLDASLTFISGSTETVLSVEIKPETSGVFVDVYNEDQDKWYLDWAYETDGVKSAEIKITTDAGIKSKFYDLIVLTEDDDALFSGDQDLYPYEPDIIKYLPVGKNSFLYVHRKAQERIIAYLDEQRIWKSNKERFSKEDIASLNDQEVLEQFRQWSTFQALLIIFEQNQNNVGDFWQEKRDEYENLMRQSRNRSSLRLDFDDDGAVTANEILNIRSTRMVRR